ncbi:serine/threonine protein kinase [Schlesneria paludicola]|uniref:serine/threonine protein kinase n=1 Tax=Schlesneria paludicola TaxID=360056 RepID=UPI00030B5FB7|nr:serine/threonine-protein kinase [Schlesneria paludicola]
MRFQSHHTLTFLADRMRFTYHTGARPLAGYTIQRGIHRGGFGEVYFAHSDAGKEVALKLLHHEERDVEIRGVTQCLNLKHPNLVSLYDLKTDSLGDRWIVMEYVSGSSLEDVLVSFPNGLPPDEVRDWLKGLVAGVAYLHERGIVHRDLKPANVYRENGIVKIGDVGLSKRIDSDRQRLQTQSVGTVYYMAPEVANGQYGPGVDVYSLGVMLYELITGKLPFQGETTAEILMKHLTVQPDLTPIPKSLRPVLARALEKDPGKRTSTVRALERDFANAQGSPDPLEIPASSFVPSIAARTSVDPTVNAAATNSSSRTIPALDQQNHALPASSEWYRRPPIILILAALALLFSLRIAVINSDMLKSALRQQSVSSIAMMLALITVSALVVRRAIRPSHPINNGRPSFAPPLARNALKTPPPLNRSGTTTGHSAIEISDVARRCGAAALIATAVSLTACLMLEIIKTSSPTPTKEHVAHFVATTIVCSWLLLISQSVADRWGWKKRARWRVRVIAGLMCGTFAFFVDRFLLISTPETAFISKSLVKSVGSQPLTVAGTESTWLGYALFFAILFGLRRWSREMDFHRRHRIQIYPVFAAALTAFLASVIISFPQWYAILWAGAISTTVQLATDYRPFEKRSRPGSMR